jgi:4-hydroxy-tetrahydrodipicolinate reductase
MTRILLNGCNGRMGQVITRMAKDDDSVTICAGVDICECKLDNGYNVYSSLEKVAEESDVIIDFSSATGLPALLHYGTSQKIPMVICTTGISPENMESIKEASRKVAILNSANMSIGVNLILSLVKTAAKALSDSFDIEIIERHHNQKLDSPSGTALAIAQSINSVLEDPKEYIYGRHSKSGRRAQREIGIHAIRGGSIVGDHTVLFAGAGEIIELNHSAQSRDVFGTGAL